MSTRGLMLGLLGLGAVGQTACFTDAEAAHGEGNFCGGFAAVPCAEGLSCVDDPKDDCDPEAGGRDCGGICLAPDSTRKRPRCDYKDQNLSYVSTNADECPAILFRCPEGSTAFFNDCGCGCQASPAICDYQDPGRRYVSQDPEQCAALRFVCNTGEQAFFNTCGCGCEPASTP
jgi:hypothetical protein